MSEKTRAILRALHDAPLLMCDLPGAPVFERAFFGQPSREHTLKFEQKLGHLYESALGHLLERSESLSCLARSLQVFDDMGRTLGELDFLLQDDRQEVSIHLELAVKFYLAIESNGTWQYPGPDARDNFHRKLKRMREHQFCLSQRPEVRMLLKDRFGIEEVDVQQLIYGCLFYPIEKTDALRRPEFVAKNCQVGSWLYARQWNQYFANVDYILLIPKPLWPIEISECTEALFEEVPVGQLLLLASERCTMFTLKGSGDRWFLAPDSWPNHV